MSIDLLGRFWTCNGYHKRNGKWEWSQWFTYDKRNGCPEHGTELLQRG